MNYSFKTTSLDDGTLWDNWDLGQGSVGVASHCTAHFKIRHKLEQTVHGSFTFSLLFTRQDLVLAGLVSCSLSWTCGWLSLSVTRSDGVDPPLSLEVTDGVATVLWMPVCPSHVSNGNMVEQMSPSVMIAGFFLTLTCTPAVKCYMINNKTQMCK